MNEASNGDGRRKSNETIRNQAVQFGNRLKTDSGGGELLLSRKHPTRKGIEEDALQQENKSRKHALQQEKESKKNMKHSLTSTTSWMTY